MSAGLVSSVPSHYLELSWSNEDTGGTRAGGGASSQASLELAAGTRPDFFEMARSRRGVSRSLSTHLVRADTYPVGSEIWTNDEGEIWVLAEVISQENTILTVRWKSTGKRLEIDLVREAHTRGTERGGKDVCRCLLAFCKYAFGAPSRRLACTWCLRLKRGERKQQQCGTGDDEKARRKSCG